MKKRQLNKRQTNQIEANLTLKKVDSSSLREGIVIGHFGKSVEVLDTPITQCSAENFPLPHYLNDRHRCHFRSNLPTLVCGDRVKWRESQDEANTGVVEAICDRHSLIERPRPYQNPKPVAANIDLIVLVIAPQPAPIANLVDRYLVAAENAGIEIIIALNKMDLLNSSLSTDIHHEIEQLLAIYHHLGYQHFLFNAIDNQFDTDHSSLKNILQGKTSVFVGQSGVGKSSMINCLTPFSDAAIGDVSSANDKGKHTTTTSKMYFSCESNLNHHSTADNPPPISGAVIDSPGIREFGLWHLTNDNIIDGFREFGQFVANCKYRNCEHGISDGCALQSAFDQGKIHPSRVASYLHILASRDTH